MLVELPGWLSSCPIPSFQGYAHSRFASICPSLPESRVFSAFTNGYYTAKTTLPVPVERYLISSTLSRTAMLSESGDVLVLVTDPKRQFYAVGMRGVEVKGAPVVAGMSYFVTQSGNTLRFYEVPKMRLSASAVVDFELTPNFSGRPVSNSAMTANWLYVVEQGASKLRHTLIEVLSGSAHVSTIETDTYGLDSAYANGVIEGPDYAVALFGDGSRLFALYFDWSTYRVIESFERRLISAGLDASAGDLIGGVARGDALLVSAVTLGAGELRVRSTVTSRKELIG